MPATVIEALIVLLAKYGPELVIKLIAMLKKKEITVEEVEALFMEVKPYEAYNIPDTAPSVVP